MSKSFDQLKEYTDQAAALYGARNLFEWDNETLAPPEASELTAHMIGVLSGLYLETMTGEEMSKRLKACKRDRTLTDQQAAIVRESLETQKQLLCIPPVEYREFASKTAKASKIWAKAKQEKDFSIFAPILTEIVAYKKKIAAYQARKKQKLYDVMLDEYEKGFDQKALDSFFGALKKELIPLVQQVSQACEQVDSGFLTGNYPAAKQEKMARFLCQYLGFDCSHGVLAVSAHPFTTNLHNHDVRITTHYTNNLSSSLFSVIHEVGHGLYELGIDDQLTMTVAGQGASMGMHESQSRFFENMIGRKEAFWQPIYPRLQKLFPRQLDAVSLKQFILAVNKVKPGLIRTEADELTYSLHIMIRYELEKLLMENQIQVSELPSLWDQKYQEYLGIRPQNPAEGILQDIHWSQGSFGYFPSYALGSAFGAQIGHQMDLDLDVDGLLRAGDLAPVRAYLGQHIHRYGRCKTSNELLLTLTGEEFTPRYYIDYLKEKYNRLYLLKK